MPRIRSVKPEFFGSEPVGNCSPTSRLLFIALWCMADDDGRCVDNPKIIRAFAFPLDDDILSADVDNMLAELQAARLIVRYRVEDRNYLAVRNFREHQHPKKRIASKLPAPEAGTEMVLSAPPVPHQFPPSSPPLPLASPTGGACSGSGSGRVEGEGVTTSTALSRGGDGVLPLLLPDPTPKPVKQKALKETGGGGAKFPNFPSPLCQEMHGLWVSQFGAVDYGTFRKAFGPLFTVAEADRPAEAPTDRELRDALKSYVDLAPMGDGARFATVHRAAAVLALIAKARREFATDPERRLDAINQLLHGRRMGAAA